VIRGYTGKPSKCRSPDDLEIRGQIMLRRELTYAVHCSRRRPSPEDRPKGTDGSGGTCRVYLHGAVGAIAHRAAQSEPHGLPTGPPAEADALDAALKDDSDARFDDIWLQGSATLGWRARPDRGREEDQRSE
jgi:hypothetical protein